MRARPHKSAFQDNESAQVLKDSHLELILPSLSDVCGKVWEHLADSRGVLWAYVQYPPTVELIAVGGIGEMLWSVRKNLN